MSFSKSFFSNNLIEMSKKADILEKEEEFKLINDWRDNRSKVASKNTALILDWLFLMQGNIQVMDSLLMI